MLLIFGIEFMGKNQSIIDEVEKLQHLNLTMNDKHKQAGKQPTCPIRALSDCLTLR